MRRHLIAAIAAVATLTFVAGAAAPAAALVEVMQFFSRRSGLPRNVKAVYTKSTKTQPVLPGS